MKIHHVILAAVLGASAIKVYDHRSSLKIPETEAVTFFRNDGDKNIPVWAIDANGHLIIDIPQAMKQYAAGQKIQEENAAKAKAEVENHIRDKKVPSPSSAPKK
jgi:hypothetical protein